MKERPILFSAPMVRAILDGSKTQTRRVIKAQPNPGEWPLLDIAIDMRGNRVGAAVWWMDENNQHGDERLCPYGQPGDRLWVRETFTATRDRETIIYRADPLYADMLRGDLGRDWAWTSSIHMPRWASRILLEVTGVRVERIQDISEEDAKAEGASPTLTSLDATQFGAVGTCREGFRQIWESINGEKSWDANPWVWVIEFKRIDSAALKQAA